MRILLALAIPFQFSITAFQVHTTIYRSLSHPRLHWHRGYASSSLSVAVPLVETDETEASLAAAAAQHEQQQQHERIFQQFQEEHRIQCQNGEAVFGLSSDPSIQTSSRKWSDDDFQTYRVVETSAGPSESLLRNGNVLFQTREPVLTEDECQHLIGYAKDAIRAGFTESREGTEGSESTLTNSELGEARLSALSRDGASLIRTLLHERLYSLLESRFGVGELTLYDGLILGNIAPSRSQPVHRDASLLTLNIPLSDPSDFTGGGTYVEGLLDANGDALSQTLKLSKGCSLCHSSGIMHAGTGLESGERWVLVLFVLSKLHPQIARRCHAQGLYSLQSREYGMAHSVFLTGLVEAPRDHLLHLGIGELASVTGHTDESFQRLQLAYDCYNCSHKSLLAMGKMLLSERRPRAALRRLDRALESIGDSDRREGAWVPLQALAWDARVTAARCALICAEQELELAEQRQGQEYTYDRVFSRRHLPVAMERVRIAMVAAPQDGRLHGLLGRATELLQLAEDGVTVEVTP